MSANITRYVSNYCKYIFFSQALMLSGTQLERGPEEVYIADSGAILASGNISLKLFLASLETLELLIF